MITNPSLKNFDPRVGFAYDPFSDHKTSIRGGFGMFHEVLAAGVWGIGYINSPPWNILSQTSPSGHNVVIVSESVHRWRRRTLLYRSSRGARPSRHHYGIRV